MRKPILVFRRRNYNSKVLKFTLARNAKAERKKRYIY